MMYLKKYVCGKTVLVAACDEELVGRTLRQGKLKLHVSEQFYVGERVEEAAMIEEIRRADISNLVGEHVVGCAIRAGEVLEENVLYIEGVPHAQIVRL
ncbi:DUF424 domain-containing protein [Methermicoccus shengliensis]|uniref:DUF424 family protein n=1 Tax=Methermicoccus shengliensis TaxID=660064 RepID=A0A832RWN1_9EURY|nr:DUF424 family protein [Methermicoccus shengliensis]KUK04983.1 MAG: Uncharacterized protein XD46_0329 [Euryarchaeota archaeon 55_53]KUK30028.1 MAG: Uncharacterized protein XD62_0869 [Methanosarcinales archeaon 56_1174]MDI3488244.1 uncharacterized protein [Methanosarcinales archaeon]MDN5295008.1 uncharacterized protein [Methanosarcinales archaeon]HIH70020.1 DUF424 family protein [Methermicoccus shengliensis]